MIYYFTNEDDHSSTKIIQWINYLGGNVKRINLYKNGILNSSQVNKSEIIIHINGLDGIDLNRDIIFYRRGMVGVNYFISNMESIKSPHKEYITNHLKQEANFCSFCPSPNRTCDFLAYSFPISFICGLSQDLIQKFNTALLKI